MDAESNENTPAISVPLFHEDIYTYIHVCMYNMHMLDKIILQVSRNVQILMRETYIYMTMDAEHTVTTPTIIVQRLHEDCEIHITDRSRNRKKNIVESSAGNVSIHSEGR